MKLNLTCFEFGIEVEIELEKKLEKEFERKYKKELTRGIKRELSKVKLFSNPIAKALSQKKC